jgi:signal peptidase I
VRLARLDPSWKDLSFMTDTPASPTEEVKDDAAEVAADAGPPPKSMKEEVLELARTVVYALLIALVLRVVLFQPWTIPSASMEPTLYEGDYIAVSKFAYGWSRHSIPFSPPIFRGRVLAQAPQRGDIVVFKLPRDNSTDYIKRLVGLPGDRIQVKAGALYVNDQAIQRMNAPAGQATCPGGDVREVQRFTETLSNGRHYVTNSCNGDSGNVGSGDNTAVYVVPANCYFMMGDNRDNSTDSRFDPNAAPDVAAYNGCPWNSEVNAALGQGALAAGVGFVPAENLEGKASMILFSWNREVSLFKPWTWFTAARWNRFFNVLH